MRLTASPAAAPSNSALSRHSLLVIWALCSSQELQIRFLISPYWRLNVGSLPHNFLLFLCLVSFFFFFVTSSRLHFDVSAHVEINLFKLDGKYRRRTCYSRPSSPSFGSTSKYRGVFPLFFFEPAPPHSFMLYGGERTPFGVCRSEAPAVSTSCQDPSASVLTETNFLRRD